MGHYSGSAGRQLRAIGRECQEVQLGPGHCPEPAHRLIFQGRNTMNANVNLIDARHQQGIKCMPEVSWACRPVRAHRMALLAGIPVLAVSSSPELAVHVSKRRHAAIQLMRTKDVRWTLSEGARRAQWPTLIDVRPSMARALFICCTLTIRKAVTAGLLALR